MAIDVYLRMDGISGESQDEQHKGWIEATSVHWSTQQPRGATASTGGGHTAERVQMADILVGKLADLSSPVLSQTCAMGRTLPKAKIEIMRADQLGTRLKYFEIELENVLIGMVSSGVRPGSVMSEHINLKFSKIWWCYTQQKISGGASGNTAGGWDLSANKIA